MVEWSRCEVVKAWYRAGRRFESWALYIYPYCGEIQFWSKFLRALENYISRRNLNLVGALNPIGT